jgi:hypothetical protein
MPVQCVAPEGADGTHDCAQPGWGNVSMKHVGTVALFACKLVPQKMAPPGTDQKRSSPADPQAVENSALRSWKACMGGTPQVTREVKTPIGDVLRHLHTKKLNESHASIKAKHDEGAPKIAEATSEAWVGSFHRRLEPCIE